MSKKRNDGQQPAKSCSRTPPAGSKLDWLENELKRCAFETKWGDSVSDLGFVLIKAAMDDEPNPINWPCAFYQDYFVPFTLCRDGVLQSALTDDFKPLIARHAQLLLKLQADAIKRKARVRKGAKLGHPGPKALITLVVVASRQRVCANMPCDAPKCGCYKRTAQFLGPGLTGDQVKSISGQFVETRSTREPFVQVTDGMLAQLGELLQALDNRREAAERAQKHQAHKGRHYQAQEGEKR